MAKMHVGRIIRQGICVELNSGNAPISAMSKDWHLLDLTSQIEAENHSQFLG